MGTGLRGRLGLSGWLLPAAAGIFVFGLGQELWSRYLPEYLRFLGASALVVGAFGALQDLLDAAYAYPGGWLSDRLGNRPHTRPVTPSNIHATIYHVLGIDPRLQLTDPTGRPVAVLDDPTPINELF